MSDDEFITNQLKFCYGDYYGKTIYTNRQLNDICIGDNVSGRPAAFVNLMNTYCTKDKSKYIIRANWDDGLRVQNKFIITHCRQFGVREQVMFPLYDYALPKSINNNDCIDFKNKKDILFWRGGTTGRLNINENLRYKVVSQNFNVHPNIDIGFTNLCQSVFINNQDTFKHLQKPSVKKFNQSIYKFILCLEGNDFASAFPWVLSSNSCPLHNYPFNWETYFFAKGLVPYVHFVPIKNDGSDLLSQFNWCLTNMEKCNQIANNGKEYMKQYLNIDLYHKFIGRFMDSYPLRQYNKCQRSECNRNLHSNPMRSISHCCKDCTINGTHGSYCENNLLSI